MSYTREPFLDIVYAGGVYLIPDHMQVIVTELFTVEAGALLILKPDAKLVVVV